MKAAVRSQQELERRIFHLKTLYDVSQEIGSQRDVQSIIETLLLIIIGTFGALRGVIFLFDTQEERIVAMTQRSTEKNPIDMARLSQAVASGYFDEIKHITEIRLLRHKKTVQKNLEIFHILFACQIHIWIPFQVTQTLRGGIGLGEKLTGDAYSTDDRELLSTLANQLTIALDYEVRGIGKQHNLFLPEQEEALFPLPREIPTRYSLVEGKHLGQDVFEGHFVKLSVRGGEVRSTIPIPPLSNVKMQLTDLSNNKSSFSLYGKVSQRLTAHRSGFLVSFTSVSPDTEAFLHRILGIP